MHERLYEKTKKILDMLQQNEKALGLLDKLKDYDMASDTATGLAGAVYYIALRLDGIKRTQKQVCKDIYNAGYSPLAEDTLRKHVRHIELVLRKIRQLNG